MRKLLTFARSSVLTFYLTGWIALSAAQPTVAVGVARVDITPELPIRLSGYQSVSSLDVFATALAVAGQAMPTDRKYDGVNLLPYVTGEKSGAPHERLFWRNAALLAVREGDWKLVRGAGKPDELYNLANDIAEARNLASKNPADLARLAGALDAWNKELIDPVFQGAGGREGAGKKNAKNKQP